MNEVINWDFAAIDVTDYELTFTMESSNKLFNEIFKQSKEKLIQAGKTEIVNVNPGTMAKFDIDPKFYNLIAVILGKQIKTAAAEVAKDKIIVLNSRVTGGCFERDKTNNWLIKIKVGGQYANKQ